MRPGGEIPRVFDSRRARNRFVVHALVLGLILAGGAVLLQRQLAFVTDPVAARAYVRGMGRWAPLGLVALQAVQVVVAPIPGQVLAVVAGYLFGPWWGTLYNMIGITIGSTVAFWLSRRFGRSYVERVIDDDALASFDGFVARHGLPSLFVLFLVPGIPDDALCFLGGLTPIRLWKLVVVAIVGRTPAFFLVNVLGDRVAAGDAGGALLFLAVVVALSLVGVVYRERIARLLTGPS